MLVSALCALGSGLATWSHYYLMPPPRLKAPIQTKLAGSLTYLTVQSNLICTIYHSIRFFSPESSVAMHAFPLAFALGFNLTPLYYGLNHFVAEKRRIDSEWLAKGWKWMPLGNHLEHGLALPLALFDALAGGHAGESNTNDTLLYPGAPPFPRSAVFPAYAVRRLLTAFPAHENVLACTLQRLLTAMQACMSPSTSCSLWPTIATAACGCTPSSQHSRRKSDSQASGCSQSPWPWRT